MLGNNLLDQSPSPAPTHAAAGVLINIDSLFARWGLPKKITSDNGLQMVPHKLCSYLKEKGIHHIRTTFYNPSANGGVELLNQSLKNGIRAHLAQWLHVQHQSSPDTTALLCYPPRDHWGLFGLPHAGATVAAGQASPLSGPHSSAPGPSKDQYTSGPDEEPV